MINLAAFLAECCVPFDQANSNCASAAHAALGEPPRLSAALREWQSLPEREREAVAREFVSDGALGRSLAIRHGLVGADKDGCDPAWGVMRVGEHHSFAIYDGARWWVRAAKGIRRVHARYIVGCWRIA